LKELKNLSKLKDQDMGIIMKYLKIQISLKINNKLEWWENFLVIKRLNLLNCFIEQVRMAF
jgi:hypothetical protein